MNAVTINNIDVNFSITDERVFISSLELSEVFEKRHDRILRAIRNLPQDFFTERNFALSEYTDKTGRILPMYKISRDGFSLLVMGFTGEKAYKWKIEFIKAFNLMEAKLKRLSVSRYVDEISSLNAVLIDKTKRHQREINSFKSQIKQHNNQIVILRHELAKYEKAHECEVIEAKRKDPFASIDDLTGPKFRPFSADHLSYKELFCEHIAVLGNNNALRTSINLLKAQNAQLKEKLKQAKDNKKMVLNLAKAQAQLDEAYRTIGAVMSYADGDKYFLEHNQITKDNQ